jgi:hypothetical protein
VSYSVQRSGRHDHRLDACGHSRRCIRTPG